MIERPSLGSVGGARGHRYDVGFLVEPHRAEPDCCLLGSFGAQKKLRRGAIRLYPEVTGG
jgi:hypothetical protein